MIKLIYGPKGTGKTKIILDQINDSVKDAKGNVVFLAKEKGYSVSIDFAVKCIYADEYGVDSVEQLLGFVKGILSGNADIEYLFIDGIARIARADLKELEELFGYLDSVKENLNIVITISSDLEGMPCFIKKYIA